MNDFIAAAPFSTENCCIDPYHNNDSSKINKDVRGDKLRRTLSS